MGAINATIRLYLEARWPRIMRAVHHPIQTQEQTFRQLMLQSGKTVYAAEHGIHTTSNYNSFANSVPVNTYETLFPYINRVIDGEADILWPGKVKWMAKSSGTTNSSSKFIPLSRTAIFDNHVRGGKDLMAMYYRLNPNADVFSGKSLIIGGSLQSATPGGAQCGDLSAVLIHQMPEWLQVFREPSRNIVLMPDWEQKIATIVSRCKQMDMRTLSGVPTWMLMILKHLLEVTGKKTVAEVWPNLELFVHGGVNFSPYKTQFEKLIGKPIHYIDAYNASEGFFAFQDTLNAGDGMLLHTGVGVFYEFIPMQQFNLPNPQAIPLSQVKAGVNYAIVITTNTGLWRYMPGDTVMFTSLQPYRIIVTGRTKHYINMVGEEVMVHNTDEALSKTCRELNCTVTDYSIGPIPLTTSNCGAHEWVVEFETAPFNLSQFEQLLDKHLRQLNSDYDAKRNGNIALGNLVVRNVGNGTFYKWLSLKNKLGGQHKVPRLSNSRTIIEELLATDLVHIDKQV